VSIAPFGETDGKTVQEIRLRSAAGAEASIISFGASLRDLVVPLANGQKRRVVLGYDTVQGYQAGKASVGATCGRVGNRIANGQFTLAGKNYQLAKNENGKTHLHGGNKGFAQRVTARIALRCASHRRRAKKTIPAIWKPSAPTACSSRRPSGSR